MGYTKSHITEHESLNADLTKAEAWCKTQKKVHPQIALSYIHSIGTVNLLEGRDGIRRQLAYVLSNLGGWRGEEARQTKQALKEFMGR